MYLYTMLNRLNRRIKSLCVWNLFPGLPGKEFVDDGFEWRWRCFCNFSWCCFARRYAQLRLNCPIHVLTAYRIYTVQSKLDSCENKWQTMKQIHNFKLCKKKNCEIKISHNNKLYLVKVYLSVMSTMERRWL